jgi:SdrD B-like domain
MSPIRCPRLNLEALDERLAPAVLNLTSHGAQGTLAGALFRQLDAGASGSDPTNTFSSMQQGLLRSLFFPEQGYNTDARPVQFDENSNAQVNHSLTLGQVPIVTVNGTAYREFLLTVNEPSFLPLISLDEVRVFLGGVGNLSGYNATTKKLAGLTAAFDLDAGGNNSVRLNDNLNRSTADMAMLIPDAVFAGASANTFVYLYSKLSAPLATGFPGPEEWSVRVPQVQTASLTGFIFVDANRNGVFDPGESPQAGVTVTLQGFDSQGNAVSLQTTTDANGMFSFSNVPAGNYTLAEQPPFGYASEFAAAGNDGGDASPGQVANINLGAGNTATGYLFGEVFSE